MSGGFELYLKMAEEIAIERSRQAAETVPTEAVLLPAYVAHVSVPPFILHSSGCRHCPRHDTQKRSGVLAGHRGFGGRFDWALGRAC
jgi:hypothetical protein